MVTICNEVIGVPTHPDNQPCDGANVFLWSPDNQMALAGNDTCQQCLDDDGVDWGQGMAGSLANMADECAEEGGRADETGGENLGHGSEEDGALKKKAYGGE